MNKKNSIKNRRKFKLAVWKFASCDGCQLSILDLEDELLTLADSIDIVYFLEASKKVTKGPYDISLVEGSITTSKDIARIRKIRSISRYIVSIGACARAGGIQALKNFRDSKEFLSIVYAKPEYIDTLDTSKPISEYVKVDFELRGCPVSKHQLLELISSFINQKRFNIRSHSVCMECKRLNNVCIMIANGIPCMGPVTHAGCNALCPSYKRGCYSCFGPSESPNVISIINRYRNDMLDEDSIERMFKTFNAYAEPFREVRKIE
jgi:coenzyme F420-reducing hydrogenase gamma subunit